MCSLTVRGGTAGLVPLEEEGTPPPARGRAGARQRRVREPDDLDSVQAVAPGQPLGAAALPRAGSQENRPRRQARGHSAGTPCSRRPRQSSRGRVRQPAMRAAPSAGSAWASARPCRWPTASPGRRAASGGSWGGGEAPGGRPRQLQLGDGGRALTAGRSRGGSGSGPPARPGGQKGSRAMHVGDSPLPALGRASRRRS